MSGHAEVGSEKRDWLVLWRVVIFVCAVVSASAGAIVLYAGGSFVRESVVDGITFAKLDDLPPRVARLEERSTERTKALEELAAWRRQKDEVDTRLTAIIEQQQRQLERQQTLLERLASK